MSYNTSLTLSKDSWSKSNKYSISHIRLQWDIFCYRLGSISDRNGFIAYFVITGLAIQEKIRIFDETFVTCCIESQDFNKFRCSLWRLFCQQDDLACQWISVNLLTYVFHKRRDICFLYFRLSISLYCEQRSRRRPDFHPTSAKWKWNMRFDKGVISYSIWIQSYSMLIIHHTQRDCEWHIYACMYI